MLHNIFILFSFFFRLNVIGKSDIEYDHSLQQIILSMTQLVGEALVLEVCKVWITTSLP